MNCAIFNRRIAHPLPYYERTLTTGSHRKCSLCIQPKKSTFRELSEKGYARVPTSRLLMFKASSGLPTPKSVSFSA